MSERTTHDGMLCPVCKVDLVMSERQGIEIDYCPKCRGVWLDRGELDKIIERSATEAAAPPPAQPASPWTSPQGYGAPDPRCGGDDGHHGGHRGGGHHGYRRGHGSFLNRLFD